MLGRGVAIAFVLGTVVVQRAAQLWSIQQQGWALAVAVLLAIGAYRLRGTAWRWPLALVAAVLVALANAHWQAQALLQQQLPLSEENQAFRLRVQIDRLVRLKPDSRQFVATVLTSRPGGAPRTVAITWASPEWGGPYAVPKSFDFPELKPGQVWQLTTFLKTPHGARNPNGFDYESHLFAQGVRAVGSVRGHPVLISEQPEQFSLSVMAERWRHTLREAMLPYVQSLRWGGVILALTIGDQASIAAADWEVFNRTGLTHLVSISGTHVTLFASLSALLFAFVWRRFKWRGAYLAERVPTLVAAACFALVMAGIYSLTAGWGVPARRTFIMFSITVLTLLLRLPFSLTQVVALAAVVVLCFDPLAILSTGFWLSFGAVLVLMACAAWWGQQVWTGGQTYLQRTWQRWSAAALWQLVISVALLPILAYWFFELSLISPVSNAYAIPIIGLLVTPLALLFALLSLLPFTAPAEAVLWITHHLLVWMMQITVWLNGLPWASVVAAKPPFWILLLALVGLVLALLPRAVPMAWVGWVMVLPALLWRPAALQAGEWRLHALDVGQGSAVLIETKSSTLLFDTGMRHSRDSDEGLRTVRPYLRSLGHKQLDVLVLSHADLDHVGGTRSVLQSFPVTTSYSSFDLEAYLQRESRLLGGAGSPSLPKEQKACHQGLQWEVDGVQFRFVWPSTTLDAVKDKNANSCVLAIRGAHHSALLTGDVGVKEEQKMLAAGLVTQDVIVVGHHGSRTSSGQPWVDQLQAQVAIAQVGWWSRYGHPHKEVAQRWQQAGARFLRTDYHGGIVVHSSAMGLRTQAERQERIRYWQNTALAKD